MNKAWTASCQIVTEKNDHLLLSTQNGACLFSGAVGHHAVWPSNRTDGQVAGAEQQFCLTSGLVREHVEERAALIHHTANCFPSGSEGKSKTASSVMLLLLSTEALGSQ